MHGSSGQSPQDAADIPSVAASRWTAQHLRELRPTAATTIPLIAPDLPRPLFPDLDLWDMWPLQEPGGGIARFDDAEYWFILSSPQLPDPDLRHGVARIRLVERRDSQWIDHGNAFPDAFTPGSREWAGSAVWTQDKAEIILYFTAAGTRGDARDNWQQRIFAATGQWRQGSHRSAIDWKPPLEILCADDIYYQRVTADVGRAGFIKGFRDPAYFADPADGSEYLLFTGSSTGASSEFDGAVGIAKRSDDGSWLLLPPLVAMDGVNNEPERPHIVHHDGRYYLLFSTQRQMFAPGVVAGPNGLYGFVADDVAGPWQPLNQTGLVAANPSAAPQQAYSWWVTADLLVYGFADIIGADAAVPVDDPIWRRAHFAGAPAPQFRLSLIGAASEIIVAE